MSNKDFSELREDPVSGEWAIIATGRSQRPHDFKKERPPAKGRGDAAGCLFCQPGDAFEDPEKSGNVVVETVPSISSRQDWWIKVIKNKYPLVQGDKCGLIEKQDIYRVQPGAGQHEVIITRDHWRSFGRMSPKETQAVIQTYQRRYQELAQLDCSRYVLIFHNHGEEAGASIAHPHSQVIAIPIIPADVHRSLEGSRRHHERTGECVHCQMIAWERAKKDRVIFENDEMIVLAPYVSKTSFELRIYPIVHGSYFEKVDEPGVSALAEALHQALGKLFLGLNDAAYNFFIHTAPVGNSEHYGHYHWHVEILPKVKIAAGFELGTDMDVSAVAPDRVGEYLRRISVANIAERQ